ncbi:pyruvyl transferase Pvg1 [Bulinus truncatus]|nr:pyruvyl transferase Pvg1 [Bulinus truncatus]
MFQVMSTVSHSLANVFKRLLVVLLLYLAGDRQATLINFNGLVLAVVGLAIYSLGKYRATGGQLKVLNLITGAKFWSPVKIGLFITFTLCVLSLSVLRSHPTRNNQVLVKPPRPWGWMDVLDNAESTSEFTSSLDAEDHDVDEEEFLSWRLVNHPTVTNLRAKTLTENAQLVDEAQRVLVNLLGDLIGNASHVMLLEIAVYNNKGDPAITSGEVLLLRKLKKKIVFYCETFKCNLSVHLIQAYEISKRYHPDDLVIVMQGGGNLVGYPLHDEIRDKIIRLFPNHLKILLSQSIWLYNNSAHFEHCKIIYSNKPNLVMFLRDPRSFMIARKYFTGIRHILAPDMAFGLGMLPRQMPPFYDIIWLRRKDLESPSYELPTLPDNVSVHASDWTSEWESNVGAQDLETAFLVAQEGVEFLLRGRVVITDRLHGHILSVLLNIPHVLVDNPPHFKLSSFDHCWTRGLQNVIRVGNGSLALTAALKLLDVYNETLPPVISRDMHRRQLLL